MYKLILLCLLVTGHLADEALEVLKHLQQELEDELAASKPSMKKREVSIPEQVIQELLKLLHEEKAQNPKRTSDAPRKDENKQAKSTENKKTEIEESCKDERDDCMELMPVNPCTHPTMQTKCARSCRVCNPCEDVVDKATCVKFVALKFCGYKPMIHRMKQLCYESCGFCRVEAPPECTASQHGCCWDGESTKEDANGSNCPRCIDQRPTVCKTFRKACESKKSAGKWMRRHCPVTCKQCEPECEDEPKFEKLCQALAQNSGCMDSELPKSLCRKSCEFC